jgi:hypothetical protein
MIERKVLLSAESLPDDVFPGVTQFIAYPHAAR